MPRTIPVVNPNGSIFHHTIDEGEDIPDNTNDLNEAKRMAALLFNPDGSLPKSSTEKSYESNQKIVKKQEAKDRRNAKARERRYLAKRLK